MDASTIDSSATRAPCSRCGAPNAPAARFCGSCGAALQPSAAGYGAPPPPPPPFPPPPEPRFAWAGNAFGGGSDNTTTVSADAPAAFDRALAAIQAEGAETKWASPPQSARFRLVKKMGGWKLAFLGSVSVAQAAPGRSTVRIDLRCEDWGKVILETIVNGVLVFALLLLFAWAGGMPVFVMLAVPLAILTVVYYLWFAASQAPKTLIEKIHGRIGSGAGHEPGTPGRKGFGLFGRKKEPAPASDAMAWTPAAAPAAAPAANDAGRATVLQQVRDLAALRDDGLITAEEFETKKAELLSRL